MANRLTKIAGVQYTPGTPYQPAQPGYCYWTSVLTPGDYSYPGTVKWLFDSNLQQWVAVYSYEPVWNPPSGQNIITCTDPVPAKPATPATISYSGIVGWNAGGRSIVGMTDSGYFGFKVSQSAIGAIVGLTTQNLNTQPNEPTHAFYIHDGLVEIIESGVVVATAPTPHVEANQFRIIRSGSSVNYSYDGWIYDSAASVSGTQYLDASMYFSGDSVFDPVLGVEQSFGATEDIGARSALGLTHNGVGYLRGITSFAGAQGEAYMNEDGDEIDLRKIRSVVGVVDTVNMFVDYALTAVELVGATGTARFVYTGAPDDSLPVGYEDGSASGVLPLLDGLASDEPYAQAYGVLPLLSGSAEGNFPTVEFSYGFGVLPPLSGTALSYTGVYGEGYGELPLLDGLAADYDDIYSQGYGTLPLLSGGGVLTTPELDFPYLHYPLLISDAMFGLPVASARIYDWLEIQGEVSAVVMVQDAIFDNLGLSYTLTFQQAMEAFIRAGLLIAGDTSSARRMAVQFAVNALTNSLTTYSGFDFDDFARTSDQTYAARPDGVYLIRPGDDNGEPIDIFLDFGAMTYGTTTVKTIEDVFFGMTTEGQVFLRANVDGIEHTYRIEQRGETTKALMSRGTWGRRWNLSLEVIDAVDFELDFVEVMVAASVRRRRR